MKTSSPPSLDTRPLLGMAWGLLGVMTFSAGLPATRIAVQEMPALFVGAGRAGLGGVPSGEPMPRLITGSSPAAARSLLSAAISLFFMEK